MKLNSRSFIRFSLAIEVTVFLVKLVAAFIVTGAALFSETLHSFTDIINSLFLYIGMRLSRRKPDPEHPFGYGMETFFWALMTAVFMITVSATFSISRGIDHLMEPHPLRHAGFGVWSLVVGTVLSMVTLVMGLWLVTGGKRPTLSSLKAFLDPSVKVKVAEDVSAVAGNLLALGAVYIYSLTGSTFYDAAVGIIVGVMLACFGFVMVLESKDLIIGRSASLKKRRMIARAALSVGEVLRVMDMKTMILGPEEILVNIEVHLVDGLDTDSVEKVMDEIRERIKQAVPEVSHIQVEVESL